MQTEYITVSPEILSRASRFFNNSPTTIFNELLQNSRRAGATQVEVTTVSDGNGTTVTIKDDGTGIFRDGFKMALGGSGWSLEKVEEEDAAGMGIFCLARCNPTIQSGTLAVSLTEDMFNGKEPVSLVELAEPVAGTIISFVLDSPLQNAELAIRETARFFPVSVTLNSQALDQKPFVNPSVPLWHGLRIARARVPHYQYGSRSSLNGVSAEINFFGIQIVTSLPMVDRAFTRLNEGVRIDIIEPGALQMVLPDRNCLVETPFLDELSLKAHEVVAQYYESLAGHELAYVEYAAFRRLFGVDLKEATSNLKAQPFMYSDYDEDYTLNQAQLLSARILDLDSVVARQVVNNFQSVELDFYKPSPKYKGYAWYDSIPKVTNLRVIVHGQDRTYLNGWNNDTEVDDLGIIPFVAEKIELNVPGVGITEVASFCWAEYGSHYVDSNGKGIKFATDFLPGPMVVSRSKTVCEVVESIIDPVFEPNDERTQNSDDQRVEFEIELRGILRHYIGDSLESLRAQISTAWTHHIGYLLPSGYEVTISNPSGPEPFKIEVRKLLENAPRND